MTDYAGPRRSTPRSWLVVFCDASPAAPRITRLLAKGYRHVLALTYRDGHWLLVDPCHDRLLLTVIDGKAAGDFLALGIAGGGVVRMTEAEGRRWWSWAPLTCVGAIRHLLGFRPLVLTPRQLYRSLLRHGGRLERYDA